MSTSKTGKHGHAKVHMVALDIFTGIVITSRPITPQKHILTKFYIISGKKYEDICPSTHNMDVPNVERKDYQLIGVMDDFLSLMDDSGQTRDDLKVPEGEIGAEITAAEADGKDILVSKSKY